MALVRGKVNTKGEQITRARELARSNSFWSAAAYLRNRHWHFEDALFILLKIRSPRLLFVTVGDTTFITDDVPPLEAVTISWPDEQG